MSGSVTDSDACGTDWEKWIPQNDSAKHNCNFSWRPPWKDFRIKLCSQDNKVLDNTSGYLVPLKMQFLMTHHLATIQKIIRNLESSTVESINATEELLEIKVKSLECEDIFTEIDRVLAREIDDIVMKPIQRLEFTSDLVEELFEQELKEKSIDLMRDKTNIFIVGFEKMKSFITKNIDEINRVTVSKVVKLGDKWKIEAVRCFKIVETLSRTFTDVVVRLQEDNHCVYLKGRDVTISKAVKEIQKLFSDLFNEKIRVDPLILKLLICKEASALFKGVLQVVWTVDQTHLYFVSKTKIDTDALKAVVYKTFLTTGFCKSSQFTNQFCYSNVFTKITKQFNDKLLFLETTKTSVNIAGTKSLMFRLLHQENVFYNHAGNTKTIHVDERFVSRMPLLFERKKIDIDIFVPYRLKPDVEDDGQASGNEETEDKPTEFVIELWGMKPTTDEDTLRYYFESRKVANADVVKIEYIEEKGMYMLWFEEESVIEAVMSKILRVDGQTLNAKRYVPPPPPKPVPKYDNKVFITNISPTTTKDGLENFLEAKSKCIPEEIIFGEEEGTALVTFEQPPDIEKFQTTCMKRHLDDSYISIHSTYYRLYWCHWIQRIYIIRHNGVLL